ncbi:MAG: glutamine amidotransferase [Planctomycetales bacterium]|nr:glutamine amidotransferase [Planctomycetales bacterium]
MSHRILYAGDTALNQQASYLAGVMSHYALDFDYLASDKAFPDALLVRHYDAVILSDYPAAHFSVEQTEAMAEKIRGGTGLFMIGGWESFTGFGGGYQDTLFAEILPVCMKRSDDRVNFSSPCLILREQGHEITDLLPFEQSIPAIGGLNAMEAKRDASVLLSAAEFKAARNGGAIDFQKGRTFPLLVVGRYGLGKTAAFASDVAPHWVGPFVDWGQERITGRANGAESIEVGNWYAEFFRNIIGWLCIKP